MKADCAVVAAEEAVRGGVADVADIAVVDWKQVEEREVRLSVEWTFA